MRTRDTPGRLMKTLIFDTNQQNKYLKQQQQRFDLNFKLQNYNKLMNGRPINPGNSGSQKNLIFSNKRYVKPMYFIKEGQQQARNLYYDNNPYYLNQDLLNDRGRAINNTTRNNNQSRDFSQTSSQRSGKVIRANGLRMAEKPHIIKAVFQQRQPSLSQTRNTDQTRKLFDGNIQLEQENRILKDENNRLRQNMRIIEQMHKKQILKLNYKFQKLLKQTQQLEQQVQQENNQWKKEIQQFSQIKTGNNWQISQHTNNNTFNHTASSYPYYSGSATLANIGSSHINR